MEADLRADGIAVEHRPDRGLTLPSPEEPKEPPMLRFCRAAAGQRGIQQLLHAAVGGGAFREGRPTGPLPLAKNARGGLEKILLDAIVSGAGLEFHGNARAEVGAGGLERLHLAILRGVAVEERAGGGPECGGIDSLVRGGDDVQSALERPEPRKREAFLPANICRSNIRSLQARRAELRFQ